MPRHGPYTTSRLEFRTDELDLINRALSAYRGRHISTLYQPIAVIEGITVVQARNVAGAEVDTLRLRIVDKLAEHYELLRNHTADVPDFTITDGVNKAMRSTLDAD